MADADADTIARQYLARCDADLAKIDVARNRLNNLMNDKVPIVDMLLAGRNLIALARSDLVKLQTYVSGHQYELDATPYMYAIDSTSQQIRAFEAEFNEPRITVEEAEKGPIIATVLEVPDGDGIIVQSKDGTGLREIRMVGINAQEIGTDEGKRAQQFLENALIGKEVEIYVDPYQPVEKYGRGLGVVKKDGVDMNQEMLRQCLAEPLSKYGRHKEVDHTENERIFARCKDIRHGYGTIKIYTDPIGATVAIDGEDLGKTPVEKELPVGRHILQLKKIDCSTMTIQIDITEGKYSRVFPLLKVPITEGIVNFKESNGLECDLEIDGIMMGKMPMMLRLEAMPHGILITKEGYVPLEDNIAPVLGHIITKSVTMIKK